MRALLIGREPGVELGYEYAAGEPYEAVVIGSLTLGGLLRFREERVLDALAQGKQVYLYTPGLPEAPKNRALAGSLTAAQRELKNWGVLFTDGGRKKLVTAQEAKLLRSRGMQPSPGAVLTPLARGNYGGNEMKVGNVIGAIWATRKAACLQGQTFLVVETGGERIVAADQVGAGKGDKVLLATGTVASKYCMDAPVDAAVVAIVDEKG